MPYSSKAKTRLICALTAWLICLSPFLVLSGEINIISKPGQDQIVETNPNIPSTAPGTLSIDSTPGQDRYLEINPPLPPEPKEEPLIIVPEIEIQGYRP